MHSKWVVAYGKVAIYFTTGDRNLSIPLVALFIDHLGLCMICLLARRLCLEPMRVCPRIRWSFNISARYTRLAWMRVCLRELGMSPPAYRLINGPKSIILECAHIFYSLVLYVFGQNVHNRRVTNVCTNRYWNRERQIVPTDWGTHSWMNEWVDSASEQWERLRWCSARTIVASKIYVLNGPLLATASH